MPASYLGIYECSQGEQQHGIAMFALGGTRFALIPDGQMQLGWERAPLEELQETWQQVRDRVGQPHAITQVLAQLGGEHPPEEMPPPVQLHEWLDQHLSPLRTVELDPFLIECKARPMEPDDQEIDDQDPHYLLACQVAEQGFRLPTPDEWEHACSGGSRHLFRWGPRWSIQVNIYDAGDDTDLSRRNGFGLLMNADPYQMEVVTSPDPLRGGDGGELVCGDAPNFASWLTAISSYVLDLRVQEFRDIYFEKVLVRRTLSVFPKETIQAIESTRVLRKSTDAPVHLVKAVLHEQRCDIEASQERLEIEAIERIKSSFPCDTVVATEAYNRFGWDIDGAVEWLRSSESASEMRAELHTHCLKILRVGRISEFTLLGQRDDLSTDAEEVVYYVAGFFERLRGLGLFTFDCADLNEGVLASLSTLGFSELSRQIADVLILGKNDSPTAAGEFVTDDIEEQLLVELRAFVESHRSEFRVLSQ